MLLISEQIAILQAIIAGKPVQWYDDQLERWQPLALAGDCQQTLDFSRFKYRIKPMPRVMYARITDSGKVGSADFDQQVVATRVRNYGGKIVQFVEVIDGEATE